MKTGKLLEENQLVSLCNKAVEVFAQEPNVQKVQAPVTICGDIHGQFSDLLELFKVGGELPSTNYLFLGDYVDRGEFSVEVISLLVALKVRYPTRLTMLRGSHECRSMTMVWGLYRECLEKFSQGQVVWTALTDLFDYFPIAAVVEKEMFCVHGGLSPQADIIDDIEQVNRVVQIPNQGIACDLIWNDPNEHDLGWKIPRKSVGFLFGRDITVSFLHKNDLKMISRSHSLKSEGFEWCHGDKLVTVFSAPNYCNRCENKAAIMEIDEDMGIDSSHFQPQSQRLRNCIFILIHSIDQNLSDQC